MPLSEEELRLLEQMERALVAEDPKLASTLRGTPAVHRPNRRRAIVFGIVFVVGIVVMMGGAIAQQTIVGVVGFGIMLASATLGLAALRTTEAPPAQPRETGRAGFGVVDGGRSSRRPARSRSGSFMERVEERWRRRRESGEF